MEATWRREVLKGERVARITNVGRVSHIALASVSPSGRHAAALEVPVTLSGPRTAFQAAGSAPGTAPEGTPRAHERQRRCETARNAET